MIEKTIFDYLSAHATGFTVHMEVPEGGGTPPFVVLEKTGGSEIEHHIGTATMAIQSYGATLYEAAALNEALKAAMAAGDARAAFEAVHALKGSTGNVALTPIYGPVCALTELLRGKTDEIGDGGDALLDEIMTQWERAKAL